MEEKIYLTELFEVYKDLLTEKQREVFEMHFVLDLSLSEMAEEKGITRQNASDALKNAKEKLFSLEKTLKIKEKNDELVSLADEIKDKKISERIKNVIGR